MDKTTTTIVVLVILGVVGVFFWLSMSKLESSSKGTQALIGLSESKCKEVEEPYTVQVAYYEEEPYTVVETYYENKPYVEEKKTEWTANWKTITGDRKYGAVVGNSTFPATFDYDYDQDKVFQNYEDYIGFSAAATIYVPRNGPVSFTIGSDDGSRLSLDGALVIDNWEDQYYTVKTKTLNLTKGFHNLQMDYYEITGFARVSFSADQDIFKWEETKYKQVEKQRNITQYRTVEKYKEETRYRTITQCD